MLDKTMARQACISVRTGMSSFGTQSRPILARGSTSSAHNTDEILLRALGLVWKAHGPCRYRPGLVHRC